MSRYLFTRNCPHCKKKVELHVKIELSADDIYIKSKKPEDKRRKK